ncbi:MAG: serine/threonine-protein kinase [Myxococcota bacterium]
MSNTLGKYTLVRKLAVGGMAEVFLARADGPMGFQKKVVVKRILPHFVDDPRFVEMFLGEARLAAELSHPNLVQIFDFGNVDGQYFIAMEYIDGPNLRVLNREARRYEGPLPLPLVARIIGLAAEGLHSAHELRDESGSPVNLVHRDISPDNILVSRNGAVKVVDFGIAKAANQPHLTKSGMIKGKMAYMPPEQLAREPLDRRADIFALGIVLYELVTGGMPFDATSEVSIIQAIMGKEPLEPARKYRFDVPPALEAIISRCLEKNAADRYPTCRELQQDLERYIQSSGEPVGTADIAQAVERLFPPDTEATQSTKMPDFGGELDPTSPSRPSAERPQAAAEAASEAAPDVAAGSTGLSHTALSRAGVRPKRTGLLLALAGVALAGVVGGALMMRDRLGGEPSDGTPPVAAPPLAMDAGVAESTAPTPDAGAVAIDAGSVVEAPAPDAGTAPVDVAQPRPARLELRIRPYATVYLDGKKLGDTPLKTQTVPAGKHTLRLVNETLGKDVEVELNLHPGANVYKANLKE